MTVQKLLEKIYRDKKLLIVFLIGLIGVLMLIFMNPDSEKEVTVEKTETQRDTVISSVSDIEKMLEDKLVKIISQVNGAGNVSAVVTVGSSGEYVYAKNTKKESDSDSMSEDSEIVIYESQNGSDSGLVLSIKSPDIIGVAIVCEGGESSVVKAEITNLIKSLFGIGSDRVYVGNKSR